MGQLFFIGLLATVSLVALWRPWVGIVAVYGIVVLEPQAVWWWHFEGLRPVLWVLLPTFVGFAIAALRGEYDFSILFNRRNTFLLALWMCLNLSYYFGPYVDINGPWRFTDAAWAISTMNKVFVLYFLACVCVDEENKLKALAAVVIGAGVYLIYWANARYLSGQVFGRMPGPVDMFGQGLYRDENNFAMLFVVICPLLWYAGFVFEKRVLRWGFWLLIPFGWHAVFLTASRGGLVGLAATTAIMAWRSKNRAFGFLLIPALAVAYFWQAGDLMRDRAGTIDEFRTESSAATRLEAWEAAFGMITAHPVTGVGIASFGPAFSDYSPNRPREAHNTFLQISAESGIVAGLMYAFTVASILFGLWKNGAAQKKAGISSVPFIYLINEAVLVSFFGLVVCSLFLSLQMFEIFYCLALMANAISYLESKRTAGSGMSSEAFPRAIHPVFGTKSGHAAQ